MTARGARWLLPLLALAAAGAAAYAQSQDAPPSLELIDPKTLRVCADPRNMPFSTQAGDGFENKLAELFAK